MRIIADIGRKGKELLSRIPDGALTSVVVLLACLGSFGLGILAGRDTRGGEWSVEELSLEPTLPVAEAHAQMKAEAPGMAQGGEYVASRTGKSYHFPWCAGAKQIKEENKIYFASKEAAEAAGYAPAKNCKGL